MPVIIKENIVNKREGYIPMQPWVNLEGTKAFVPVPKAASTTVVRVLSHENHWTRSKVIPNVYFGLIRHPVERWISGTAEHWNPILTRGGNDLTSLINTSFEELLEQSFEDRHTVPQAWNFDKYPDIKLFQLNNIHLMWNWLDIDSLGIHERDNLTMGGLQKDIREIVAGKTQRKWIESAYDEDMQLWREAI